MQNEIPISWLNNCNSELVGYKTSEAFVYDACSVSMGMKEILMALKQSCIANKN